MIVGHANGEPVLLARQGGHVFAVGATCTHYSGPLGEGLLVDGTVRCPWHHACFDLRSGEPLRAPGTESDPVLRRAVEDGVVRVGNRRTEPRLWTSPAGVPARILIVGAGAAGHAAAETLRREGYRGELTMIGADPRAARRSAESIEGLLGGQRAAGMAASASARVLRRASDHAEARRARGSIDTARKRVVLEDGSAETYDKLLLATGADPVKLDLRGADLPHVYYLRTLEQAQAIVDATKTARRAVVIGSSFIGLEVAASLRARNVEVHVVGPDSVPLEKVMGPELGGFIRKVHEKHGVKFHLGTRPVDRGGVRDA